MFGGDKTREFQQGMDQHGLRREREQDRLSLRRKKREEQLQRKRRQIMASTSSISSGQPNGDLNINSSNSLLASTAGIKVASITVDNLAQYITAVRSSSERDRIHGTMCIRILLSKPDSDSPPYKQIMESGIAPILLSFFRINKHYKNNEKLQFEAAWAITNLCSSTKQICEYLCSNDAIKAFEHLLTTTKHFEIMEQAVWGLGNIAGESQHLRNIIIRDGIFQFLLERAQQFLKSKNYTLCRNAVWCLSNLVRYDGIGLTKQWKKKHDHENSDANHAIPSDLCPWKQIKNMIPIFNRLLNEIGGKIKKLKIGINSGLIQGTDPEYNQCLQCCSDCLWTIHYSQVYFELCRKTCTYICDVFNNSNLIDVIILFMQMDSVLLLSPSIRIIGTFLSVDDDFVTCKILDKGFLGAAMLNLNCKVRLIRKEVCWTLSNIAGCDFKIATSIIEYDNGQLLKSLTNVCLFDDDQVKKEAGWVLANIISLSDPNVIHFMVEKGVIGALRAVMKTSSVKQPLITCMEAFDIIMSHSKTRDGGEYDYIHKVEESGCCEIFDILQAGVDDNDKVFTTSYELVNKYWPQDNSQPWVPPMQDAIEVTQENNSTTQQPQHVQHVQQQDVNEEVEDDEEDDDIIPPNQNSNNGQFQFGIVHNDNNNNIRQSNGNNNNGNNNNQPFQF